MASPRRPRSPKKLVSRVKITNETIYDRIYAAICERHLPPGIKLSEEKLAKVFGVSRTRIREILCRLANEKIVTLITNRGAFVTQPTVEQTRAVFEARRAIESATVKRVAEFGEKKSITRLYEHVQQQYVAREANNRPLMSKLSGEFHVLIAELAGNPFLYEEMRSLSALTRLIIYQYDSSLMAACLDDEHKEIVATIERHDPVSAEQLMVEHLRHIESRINLNVDAHKVIDLEKIFSSLAV